MKERYKNTPEYMDRYWEQAASLTPCFVMTAYQVPRYLKLCAPEGAPENFDVRRIDPESDQGIVEANELGWRWDFMKEYGLTSSHSSFLMLTATQSSRWVYSTKNYPGVPFQWVQA